MAMPNATATHRSRRTRRINWSPNIQDIIRRLYLDEGVTLDKLPQRMQKFGFCASRRSYCSKLSEWGLRRKKKGKNSGFSSHTASNADPTSVNTLRPEPLDKYAETAIRGPSGSPEPMPEERPMRDLHSVDSLLGALNGSTPKSRDDFPRTDTPMMDNYHSIAGFCAACFTSAISNAPNAV